MEKVMEPGRKYSLTEQDRLKRCRNKETGNSLLIYFDLTTYRLWSERQE